jgi:nitroreductase
MTENTAAGFDPNQVNLLMRSRRSVFPDQFEKGRVIPDEIIIQLLENANWAPNHKRTEPWRFVVFTGDGLEKLASFQSALYKQETGEGFKQNKYEKLATTPMQCSHVIAIGMKRSLEVSIPEIEEITAVACALENLYLSTSAYNLGGYFSTGGITYLPGAKAFLRWEDADLLLGFFYLGYIAIPPAKGSRKPVADKITWVKK